jgi:hypothetical protein
VSSPRHQIKTEEDVWIAKNVVEKAEPVANQMLDLLNGHTFPTALMASYSVFANVLEANYGEWACNRLALTLQSIFETSEQQRKLKQEMN